MRRVVVALSVALLASVALVAPGLGQEWASPSRLEGSLQVELTWSNYSPNPLEVSVVSSESGDALFEGDLPGAFGPDGSVSPRSLRRWFRVQLPPDGETGTYIVNAGSCSAELSIAAGPSAKLDVKSTRGDSYKCEFSLSEIEPDLELRALFGTVILEITITDSK